MIVVDFWKALKAGKEIKNPATWKSRQNAINAVSAIISFIVAALPLLGVNVPVSDADQMAIATGLASVLCLINVLLTTATTKKIGLPLASSSPP